MSYPTPKGRKTSILRSLMFHIRNFISSRKRKLLFNLGARARVRKRGRKRLRNDRRWLEKRHTKLAKKFTGLELKYLNQKDEIRRLRNANRLFKGTFNNPWKRW